MQKQFKKSCLLGVGLLGLAIAPVATQAAEAELTANASITSNYVFRGITQTDDSIAVQGGVDYVHEVGFYAGAWASNVDIETSPGSGVFNGGFELDLYAGYNFKLNEDVLFDVGYILYEYTDSGNADAADLYFGASFKDVSVTYYLGDIDGGTNNDYSYIDIKYSMALPSDFNLHVHYGNMSSDAASSDYQDVAVGVSKEIEGFDVGLTLTTIDHDNSAAEDDIVFITASKAFNIM